MMPMPADNRAADGRGAARASLYLAAALYCDGAPTPIKVRNLSSGGALVEGRGMPAPGALVQLVRGALIVHGLVAWSAGGRCGLKFSGSVDVQQWRSAQGNSDQQRVDEVVRLVKAGAVPLPIPSQSDTPMNRGRDELDDLAGDLDRASELLDALGACLASDAGVVIRHAQALQNLDIAMQVIAAVRGVLAGDSDLEIDATKLPGLRRSAGQALRRDF